MIIYPSYNSVFLGAISGGKHESWEFDSGARDLSPEPNSIRMQHLLQSGGSANTGSLLHLANKVYIFLQLKCLISFENYNQHLYKT